MATSPVIKPNAQPVARLSFPRALDAVADGKKVTKESWGDESFYVLLRDGYLMLHKDDGKYYQLIISEADLVGIDWYVLETN